RHAVGERAIPVDAPPHGCGHYQQHAEDPVQGDAAYCTRGRACWLCGIHSGHDFRATTSSEPPNGSDIPILSASSSTRMTQSQTRFAAGGSETLAANAS